MPLFVPTAQSIFAGPEQGPYKSRGNDGEHWKNDDAVFEKRFLMSVDAYGKVHIYERLGSHFILDSLLVILIKVRPHRFRRVPASSETDSRPLHLEANFDRFTEYRATWSGFSLPTIEFDFVLVRPVNGRV